MAPIKAEMNDPSMSISPDKRPPIPNSIQRSNGGLVNRQNKDKRGLEKDMQDAMPNLTRPPITESANFSTIANAGFEGRIEKKPPLNQPDSLALCAVSPHKAPMPVVLRRVTREEVVQPLAVALPAPPTPPTVDVAAIVAAFFQHLQQNPQHLRVLQLTRRGKREPLEVITLEDEEASASTESPADLTPTEAAHDPDLAALMAILNDEQKRRFYQFLSKVQIRRLENIPSPTALLHAPPTQPLVQQLPLPTEDPCEEEIIALDDSDNEVTPSFRQLIEDTTTDGKAPLNGPATRLSTVGMATQPATEVGTSLPEHSPYQFIPTNPDITKFMEGLTAEQKKQFAELFCANKLDVIEPSADFSPSSVAELQPNLLQLTNGNISETFEDNHGDKEDSIHRNYWRYKTKSKRCPACRTYIGTNSTPNAIVQATYLRSKHYYQYHYDIYFSQKESKFNSRRTSVINKWLGERLGLRGTSDSRGKKWTYNSFYNRVCLHCKKNSALYNGRLWLLKHIQQAHPEVFSTLKMEYSEIAGNEDVEDTNIHLILIGASSPQIIVLD